ncbi:hypothetical protein Purlil1_7669 [Purpureocillium lilacinum]|uniref:CsbD-like domain-containing protein n=1 Tax=Purpureocillium lilacinum TaxID=33203 RepID=A0ABR0BV45_PURLI|nr:hypothetical protein Purlil1_7669 [Purpureocillium lilacinum]
MGANGFGSAPTIGQVNEWHADKKDIGAAAPETMLPGRRMHPERLARLRRIFCRRWRSRLGWHIHASSLNRPRGRQDFATPSRDRTCMAHPAHPAGAPELLARFQATEPRGKSEPGMAGLEAQKTSDEQLKRGEALGKDKGNKTTAVLGAVGVEAD